MKKLLLLLLLSSAGAFAQKNACPNQANITVTASAGPIQLAPAVAGRSIHICHIELVPSAATSVTLVAGTGTNCSTGQTAVAGPLPAVVSYSPPLGTDVTVDFPTSQAACVVFSAAQTTVIYLKYQQY